MLLFGCFLLARSATADEGVGALESSSGDVDASAPQTAAADAADSGDGDVRAPRDQTRAEASAASDAGAPAEHIVTPPALSTSAQALYPPEARAQGRSGTVILSLTIDREGNVTAAEVVQPLGHGFDEAAREAALRFRFTPATRDGAPVPSRIRYAYAFRLAPPSPVAPPLPAPARSATQAALKASVPTTDPVIAVAVYGRSKATQLRESAQAVQVVETAQAKRESGDLGEVLARAQGIGVRRGGGLGSETRFSLAGLTDDQIRFFLNGVPLELAGYPFGIANVPVHLVERVEVYRGVVPIRFGADALGGAVNLVSDEAVRGTHGSASYQAGSFNTHRVAVGGRHLNAPSGFLSKASAFFDYAHNDYPVDVQVPSQSAETRGQLVPARVYRFHDGYRAAGGSVELGLVDRAWADRLVLRGFASQFGRDLQHNPTMTTPYGEAEYARWSTGASLLYRHLLAHAMSFDVVLGYAHQSTDFSDESRCQYNWFGQCARARQKPGEIDQGTPRDDTLIQDAGYARVVVGYRPNERHEVRLSVAPTYVARRGEDRLYVSSTVAAERALLTVVGGAEYQLDVLGDRLQNITFAKAYLLRARSDQPVLDGVSRELSSDAAQLGAGNALRYRLTSFLYTKASYEYATRLPGPDEIFGDGVLTNENLELEPEVSHNVNLGLTLDLRDSAWGAFRADVNGFLREAKNLIVKQNAYGERFRHENVFSARSVGAEASSGWTSKHELVRLDGNVTYLDFRNRTNKGPFASFRGDRIPNRPYFFVNGTAQLQAKGLVPPQDRLILTWNTRYVHDFFEFWESAGRRDTKRVIPDQLVHTILLTYLVERRPSALSFTGEVSNLTDARVFDFFGAQRPGRAVFFKTTAQF